MKIKKGDIVKVFNSSISGERIFEGNAEVMKIYHGDDESVYASVAFIDDEHKDFFSRNIYAEDQDKCAS